jgi:iron complex outermembrane recepter protein
MGLTYGSRSARSARTRLAVASSAIALLASASLPSIAHAADADAPSAGAGAEGAEVSSVVVTAERDSPAAATAPSKASLDETQPESIISRSYIEQVTPETGGWTTVVAIAPSISGISSNGGGVGDYQTVTMRGFQDGEFNVTYDGIAFGDTNNPTHHSADYFPASTVGAVVVDRGPGAAGDLGQANFGGAIHFFSPGVADQFGMTQKFTLGSFDTWASVTTINTGEIAQLNGAKLLLNFDERGSQGELSDSAGHQYNQLAKLILPLGDDWSVTLFANHEYTEFNFEDSSGPGETWQQVALLGKNFYMNDNPNSEHYTGFNYEVKRTDFEYADFKGPINPTLQLEDQVYTYWYSNKTKSTNDLTGALGPDQNWVLPGGPNTSPPTAKGSNPDEIGGYDKLNEYRVIGDVVRFTQDWSFGTLKIGGLVEGSRTFRRNCLINDSLGMIPDQKFAGTASISPACKTLEESSWLQGQFFADFYWRPTSNLTITPGFKYVDFNRSVNAPDETIGTSATGTLKNQSLVASNNYQSPLYFLTANYKIQPDLAVYGQIATSFLIPELSDLYVTGVNLQSLQSEYTTNYQLGAVYTHGRVTADADIYLIDATNLQVACSIPDPTNPTALDGAFCNAGKARFQGVEGEAAYAFDFGLTLFANGSLNQATQLANTANLAAGIAANPRQELANSPLWTDAVGALYSHGPWRSSLTFKQSGSYVDYNTPTGFTNPVTFHLPGYYTLDASIGYDFGHFAIKLQGFNLTDVRAVNSFTPGGNAKALFEVNGSDGKPDSSIYTFQAGRDIELTLIGKF